MDNFILQLQTLSNLHLPQLTLSEQILGTLNLFQEQESEKSEFDSDIQSIKTIESEPNNDEQAEMIINQNENMELNDITYFDTLNIRDYLAKMKHRKQKSHFKYLKQYCEDGDDIHLLAFVKLSDL
ncbi:hypothetical protein pb186bvf_003455 [Paramecium bursaria]